MQLVLNIVAAPADSDQLGESLVVPPGGASIGRGANNTIVLPDVSRITSSSHATITEQAPGSFVLVDHSSNGTYLNNGTTAIEKGVELTLRGGELLTIGPYQLSVQLREVTPQPDLGGGYLDALGGGDVTPSNGISRIEPVMGKEDTHDDIDKWLATGAGQPATNPPVSQSPIEHSAMPPSLNGASATPLSGDPPPVDPLELLDRSTPAAPPGPAPLFEAPSDEDSQWWKEPQPDHAPPIQHAMTPPRILNESQGSGHEQPAAEGLAQCSNESGRGAGLAQQLGLSNISPERELNLTPEVAAALLQVVSRLMEILRARSMIKNEIRTAHTVIGAAENNPLKFAAQVQDAMNFLFGEDTSAFMSLERAIEDSFNDLEDHQFAMLAGMQAAYESMLSSFEPGNLLEETGVAAAEDRLSGGKKAKAWDAFRKHYDKLREDQEAAYHRLFGDEFARRYEEQVNRLKQARRDRSS